VRGLNVLAATVSTPLAAPVVAAARLRGGNARSARGAGTLVAEAINIARQAGATGMIVVRADSAYYAGAFVAACRRHRARFSVTVRMDPKVRRAIATIPDDAWTGIHYPNGSTTSSPASGSPTPRSPRCPTPRSPPAAPTAPTVG
jgi:hypothetical protein